MLSSSDSGFCRSHGVVLEQLVSYPTNHCECLVTLDRITCISSCQKYIFYNLDPENAASRDDPFMAGVLVRARDGHGWLC
jgi:hypothetical protein